MLEDVYTPLCTVLFGEHCLTLPSELLYLFLSWFFTTLISMGKTLCVQSAYRAASSSIKSARWPSQTRQLWHAQITTQLTPTTIQPLRETISHSFAHWSLCDFEVFEVWSLLLSMRDVSCYPTQRWNTDCFCIAHKVYIQSQGSTLTYKAAAMLAASRRFSMPKLQIRFSPYILATIQECVNLIMKI